ncbi:competence type IV pilus major pilin ComGC [Halobacillus sp. B29]|uniref:competence type IV pilus major pilin ComGC n=1 Tax=Halobacillus sp. B29 TaxID=3457432 RepID=UPI003FCD7603
MKNDKGFTLIEMLIVLLVISVLMIITIPNLTKNNGTIRDKGCEALVITAQAQAEAYSIENGAYPANLSDLVEGQYLKQTTCPDGGVLGYDSTSGEVSAP